MAAGWLCGVAFSYWHISLSRLGFRAILLPLIAALAFAFFWRAWREIHNSARRPWGSLILCGVLVGVSLYTYTASRFIPILITIPIIASLVLPPRSRLEWKRGGTVFGMIALVSLIVFLPLAIYFLQNPDSFFGRSVSVSILNPYFAGQNPVVALGNGIMDTVKMFYVLPDPNLRHNPAGQPVIDLALAAWLAVGTLVAIVRWRTLPYLFLLSWLPLFILPAILTAEGVPHSLRASGIIPAVYIVPVIGMMTVAQWIGRNRQPVALLVPLLFVTFSSFSGVRSYFTAWGDLEKFRSFFLIDYVQLSARMFNYGEEDGVWILPLSPNFHLPDSTFYSIDFLYRGTSGYGAVLVDEETLPQQLSQTTDSYHNSYLIHANSGAGFPEATYILGDPKELIEFALEKHAQFRFREDDGIIGLPFSVYELPPESSYSIAEELVPRSASFAGKVKLLEADYGHTILDVSGEPGNLSEDWTPSGHRIWAVLHWEAEEPIEIDLKIALILRDPDGHIVGQVDDLLVGDRYPVARVWEEGEQTGSYHILPTLPGIAPGRYQLFVKVYEDVTQRIYPVVNDDEVVGAEFMLGTIDVTRPLQTPDLTPTHALPPTSRVSDDLRLLGYDLPKTTLSPGDTLPLILYWEALSAPERDYAVEMKLYNEENEQVISAQDPFSYPTSEWEAGDKFRLWHDLPIPPLLPSGTYALVIGIIDGKETVGEIDLGQIEVAGRVRYFETPPMAVTATGTFAQAVQLLGINSESPILASPGDSISFELIWQVLDVPQADLIRFVHLLDESGQPIAQQDTIPCEAACPTSSWLQNEILTDSTRLVIPIDAAAVEYRVAVGWYDSATLQRADALDQNGQQVPDGLLYLSLIVEVHVGA